jgi:spoIIIJ-associated protein
LANVFSGRLKSNLKVIVDTERYRERREETLIRLAKRVANQVRRDHQSTLLEPMNPFERRLIHTSLNDMKDIATKSEGEGLYKQVRVYYRGE